jgi:hypothetical protein
MRKVLTSSGVIGPASSFEIVAASVTGQAHEASGEGCQDFFAFDSGNGWAVAVVSDGAGSAARALDGARIVGEEICQMLAGTVRSREASVLTDGNCSWANDSLAHAIEYARARCLAVAKEDEQLSDFHATVVGVLLLERCGLLFHIGDGGVSVHRRCSAGLETIAFSEPENGEYSNQTFFFTEPHWKSHLRTVEIGDAPESVWLMTDGAYELAVSRQLKRLRDTTEDEVIRLVFQEPEGRREAILRAILSSPQAAARNDDDKTVVIIRKRA